MAKLQACDALFVCIHLSLYISATKGCSADAAEVEKLFMKFYCRTQTWQASNLEISRAINITSESD